MASDHAFGRCLSMRGCHPRHGYFLGGKIYVGDVSYESGPDGMFPSAYLPDSLEKLGISMRRFKTGTPPGYAVLLLILPAWKFRKGIIR